jgi:hypothetical protein
VVELAAGFLDFEALDGFAQDARAGGAGGSLFWGAAGEVDVKVEV